MTLCHIAWRRAPFLGVLAAMACFALILPVGLLLSGGEVSAAEGDSAVAAERVDFRTQVRPILAANCFTCHGPDEAAREGDLRLDQFDDAVSDRGGYRAITPGDHRESELWVRVTSSDDDLRMPPSSHEPLTPEQAETLAKWIDQGAEFQKHWAFIPPTRPAVPVTGLAGDGQSESVGELAGVATSSSPIDAFLDHALAAAGLQAGDRAAPHDLVRRLHLDLVGIPPTPEQADAFAADPSSLAYARLVDRLLASPEYAERWARPWLDLARYADTNGYEKDRPRTIWPYRDWVLDALNRDMPFDRFSILQLAGDMLEDAAPEDRVATGFHRNTMLNEEGGIDPQEFRFHAMNDRVATTGTVWMGLTIGCAQCHTHKYDPITHRDYYSLYAFLNEADDIEAKIGELRVTDRREEILNEIRSLEDGLIAKYLVTPPATLSEPDADEAEPAESVPAEVVPAEVAAGDDSAGDVPTESNSKALSDKPASDQAPSEKPPSEEPEKDEPPSESERQAAVWGEFQAYLEKLRESAGDWRVVVPREMASTMPILRTLEDGSILASGDVTKREVYTLHFDPLPEGESFAAIRLEALPDDSLPAGGPGMAFYEGRRGDFFLSELVVTQAGQPVGLKGASASYGKISIGSGSADAANVIDGEGSTGWSTSGREGHAERWVAHFKQPLAPNEPWSVEMTFERHFAAPLGRFRLSLAPTEPVVDGPVVAEPGSEEPEKVEMDSGELAVAALPLESDVEAALEIWRRDPAQIPPAESLDRIRRRFIEQSETLRGERAAIEKLRGAVPEPVRTLVLRQRPEEDFRVTHRYHRGEYLHPRETVDASIPEIFAGTVESPPTNREEFARWLVSPANPLFARVTVDRAWRELFGRGIVDTAGDYGTQSESPSHPELLDYLATEFLEDGMSVKRLHRRLVLTDAYQRDSRVSEAARAIDPENRLLASGPRRRLEAERIRDSLLSAAGLLTHVWGGSSVFPPQPASVTNQAYGRVAWNESKGGDRYRRSVYTYAKRTAPFAAFGVFDGPTGETCMPRRDISNSPLQALTLLNDAMFLEMGTALAEDVLRQLPGEPDARIIEVLFRRLLTRPPTAEETAAIAEFHAGLEQPESAFAWGLVARALMNLDEAITTP